MPAPTSAHLARLLGELLLKILSEVLRYKDVLKPSQARLRKWLHHNPLRVQADVLYTCKALQKVGSEVLYSQNAFDFWHASTSEHKHAYQADQWLAKIGSVNLGFIKSLAFSYNLRLFDPACFRGHDYLRRKQAPHSHIGSLR
jgi:hypothetical protein